MKPEEYLGKVLDMTEQAMHSADRAQERMIEQNTPEPKRVQCAHCNGYYPEDEIDCKPMCYKCEEELDDYHRVMSHRNRFLFFLKTIKGTTNIEVIHSICDGILSQYKEE